MGPADPAVPRVEQVTVLRRIATATLLLCAAACSGGRGTPEETLDSLRSAVAANDGARLYELHDLESRAFHRDHVRTWKARLERGDDPEQVLMGIKLQPEFVTSSEEQSVAERWIGQSSPLIANAGWLETATIAERKDTKPGEEVCLVLRGTDGSERAIWFVRERGSWAYDHYRTRW